MAKLKTPARKQTKAAAAVAAGIISKSRKPADNKSASKKSETAATTSRAKTKQTSVKRDAGTTQPATADSQPIESRRKLPNVLRISRTAAAILWRHKKLFLGIFLIYVCCNILLVQTATALRHNLTNLDTTSGVSLNSGLTRFSILLASAGSGATQAGGAYLSLLITIVSLAVIWALRESFADRQVRIRDSFYKGMYPLIPSVLVLLMIFIHLLPVAVGAGLFGLIARGGIATNIWEILAALVLPLAGICASIYFLTHSIIAAYIVTLPDMTPLKALRSAKKLVRYRRWSIIRKLLFIPLAFVVIAAIVMLPFVLYLRAIAPQVFFVFTAASLIAVHAYLYTLYRELLA